VHRSQYLLLQVFKKRLNKAKKLIYFTDNCGGIVFDRLLLEGMYDLEITIAIRTLPVLIDATTLQDACSVGLTGVAEVIENGIQVPLAGTIFAKVSPKVRSLVEKADLLISKGGANPT
jgi:damage-control phosphatase, subfamily I